MNWNLSKMITNSRESLGYKQGDLGVLCDVSETTISSYENAKSMPSVDIAIKLADKLNNPAIEWEWLRSNKIGSKLLPKVPDLPLSQCYLNLHCATLKAVKQHEVLAEISKDNIISKEEVHEYLRACDVYQEIFSYGLCFQNKRHRSNGAN